MFIQCSNCLVLLLVNYIYSPLLIEEGQEVVVDNKYLFANDYFKVFYPTTTPNPSSIRRGKGKQCLELFQSTA